MNVVNVVWIKDEPFYADPFTLSAVSMAGCERLLSPGCGSLTATALCRSSVCRPPAPPGAWCHSTCINATQHPGSARKESYRPEGVMESGPGLGTLLFHGMPLPRL